MYVCACARKGNELVCGLPDGGHVTFAHEIHNNASTHPLVGTALGLSVYLSTCLPVYLSICLSDYLSTHAREHESTIHNLHRCDARTWPCSTFKT
jgi:hypothetical protein